MQEYIFSRISKKTRNNLDNSTYCFSLAANTAFIALMAADLGINKASNINWARGQIHYMLGDNPRQSSYVVGFGQNPPKRPHHKSRYSFIVDELPTSQKHMRDHNMANLIS